MKRTPLLKSGDLPLYQQIEELLIKWIDEGKYLPGSKFPSVRKLSDDLQVSKSTIIQTYTNLEMKGLIEAKPQSGFYVALNKQNANSKLFQQIKSKTVNTPKFVSTSSRNLLYVQSCGNPKLVPLGAAVIDQKLLPVDLIMKSINKVTKSNPNGIIHYERLAGNLDLCKIIAKKSYAIGIDCVQEDILITNGCLEAINLALSATTKPGDTVAVESPTFYSFLRLLEDRNLKVLEIPTDSETGMNLNELEEKLKKFEVKAAIFTPNFNNPLGNIMSDENKEKLVKLSYKYNFTIIEDDVYAELYFEGKRPTTLKSFDQKDEIFFCSSFSKTLSAGLRIGWMVAPKKYRERIELLKGSLSLATNSVSQLALVDYFQNHNYDRQMRKLRTTLKENMQKFLKCIEIYFPPGTKVTNPKGGCLLWIEFPNYVDCNEMFDLAFKQNISILPGSAFSVSQNYKNYIRLNFGVLWSEEIEMAIKEIGSMAHKFKRD